MLTLTPCPERGAPAEITDRFRLPSADGPVDHVVVHCIARHFFRMPADMLVPRKPGTSPDDAADLSLARIWPYVVGLAN